MSGAGEFFQPVEIETILGHARDGDAVTHHDITSVRLDDRGQAEALGQRRRGLVGAAQRRDINTVEFFVGQALADQLKQTEIKADYYARLAESRGAAMPSFAGKRTTGCSWT